MKKALFGLFLVSMALGSACADEPQQAQPDFITSTVNTVCDKVNAYMTGKKDILDWSLIKPESQGRAPDALDEKLNSVTIRSGPLTSPGKTQ